MRALTRHGETGGVFIASLTPPPSLARRTLPFQGRDKSLTAAPA